MFAFFKRLLNRTSPVQNRFADTDWKRELAVAVRRTYNEEGMAAENGAFTELELGEGAHFIVLHFKNENEDRCIEILDFLNEIDNRVLASCKRRFSIFIVSDDGAPQIDYTSDEENSGFVVYLDKRAGKWQGFWDSERQKPV